MILLITEALFNLFMALVYPLLYLLPDISWDVNPEVFDSFFSLIEMAGYLLPMGTVVSILTIIVLFNMFKIVIAIIKTIWQLLPFT